ncbi:MAG TPA: ATP-binding protein [Candidatus Dependentiae bacterium]|nr:ATP-binding protein [Candidatus Dependentiae bacterium]HRQ62524.1 ATP-binding protein [Candidatus Dependentiae bacterium]
MKIIQKLSIFFLLSVVVLPSYSMEKPSEDQKRGFRQDQSKGKGKGKYRENMDQSNSTSQDSRKTSMRPFHKPTTSGSKDSSSPNPDLYTINFTDDLIKEMKQVAKNVPEDAKNIINHLEDPTFLRDGYYRYATFVGEPGTGKSTQAKFIAYKLSKIGWQHRFISSGELLEDTRNRTLVRLRNMLHELISSDIPFIFIIDELNELLENTESAHYDTSATAKFLWPFLDAQDNNHNFFFIGTMNRDSKLPHAFKNRVCLRRIKFHLFTDIATKNAAFRSKFDEYIKFDQDIDDQYLDAQLQKIGTCSGRDLREFSSLLRRIFRRYDKKSPIFLINKKYLEEGINEYIENRDDIQHDDREETEATIRERHYVQEKIEKLLEKLGEERVYCVRLPNGNPQSGKQYIISLIESGNINTIYDLVSNKNKDQDCRYIIEQMLILFTDEQTKIAEDLLQNIIRKRKRALEAYKVQPQNNEGCSIL